MTEPIQGKVAQVLNDREIAINLGSAKGVTVGMYFDVLTDKNITDPDTGEVLGSIKIPKVRVRVIQTQEKLSVATTYLTKKVNIGGTASFSLLGPFSRSLMPPKWITKYQTLKKTAETPDPFDEKGIYVKIGDPVVQVLETDEADNEK